MLLRSTRCRDAVLSTATASLLSACCCPECDVRTIVSVVVGPSPAFVFVSRFRHNDECSTSPLSENLAGEDHWRPTASHQNRNTEISALLQAEPTETADRDCRTYYDNISKSRPTKSQEVANEETMKSDVVALVTGGTGMIGRAIANIVNRDHRELNNAEKWIFASSKDADLSDYQETRKLFESVRPTHVIHLASKVASLFADLDDNLQVYSHNVHIHENVSKCADEFGVKRLVTCCSACLFPENATFPLDEFKLHTGPPPPAYFSYGYAERIGLVFNQLYHQDLKKSFTTAILCSVYGPGDNFNVATAHAIPGLIHRCYLAKLNNTPFTVYGTGGATRQFMYCTDAARLLIWALFDYDQSSPIVLAVDEQETVSIAQLAQTIADAIGFKGRVVYDSTKTDGQPQRLLSNKKLRSLLPEMKFTSLDEGLNKTVSWFLEHYDTARK